MEKCSNFDVWAVEAAAGKIKYQPIDYRNSNLSVPGSRGKAVVKPCIDASHPRHQIIFDIGDSDVAG
jgi:hypothetical protein